MSGWSDCGKFEEFRYPENKRLLKKNAGIYEFGYFYAGEFLPKYLGRVRWTEHGYDFYTRFKAYDSNAHNDEVASRVKAARKALWFRVKSVVDPAFTESQMLLADFDGEEFATYEWNAALSHYADTYYKDNWRDHYSAAYI